MLTKKQEFDKPKSNCGVFGIFGTPHASALTYYGLFALQHRGQEACGITSCQNISGSKILFHSVKGSGLVSEIFHDDEIFKSKLIGDSAIGHNRYSTTGSDHFENIQPFNVRYRQGNLAVSHNGNLTNAKLLREELVNQGSIFRSSSDTEVILHLISRSKEKEPVHQIKDALDQIKGAFSLVILTDDKLIAARDGYGIRPLVLGELENSFVISSETCAFDLVGAKYVRDIKPGEILVIDDNAIGTRELQSLWLNNISDFPKKCIFEFIYFSRPDSIVFGENVDKVRRKLGKNLAIESPVTGDDNKVSVISVPDSSNTIAIGYQSQLRKQGIDSKLEIGLIRNHYVGRTFIQPGQDKRELSTRIKFNTVKGVLQNQEVVVVDDSIVRGTTSKMLVKLLREAAPEKIHLRISSPPILYPCHYGMDFPSREELIANEFSGNVESIKQEINVESLHYLSFEGMLNAVAEQSKDYYCTACFNGDYPIPIDENFKKNEHEV
ncbi:MAG: amidophosphoribosyltransferase [Bacteroidetes bacterium]|nr:amidophosphoribosyltransferase [Bacteroidota bacterium]MBU2583971.1 amidophosphoribosyltransferase [Bacteroidota bacterium]